jgi:hypothetical protein
MMKRIITGIVSLLMATMLLAGCSNNPTPTQAAPGASATQAAPASPATPTTVGYPGAGQQGGTSANPVGGYPAAGQGAAATSPANQNLAGAYPAGNQTLMFNLPGGITQPVTADGLNALPTATVNIEGKDQSLRSLADALKMVGADTYTKVTINGQNGSLTITKDQVAQAYLDIQADGKIRLLVQGADPAQWPVGVTTIKVE